MNSPTAALKRARDAELAEASDLKKFKADLLARVIVKTIVKEQTTDRSVAALRFNHLPTALLGPATGDGISHTSLGNLFATCGGDFATVYDDEHFGDNVAVVSQFKNEKTTHVGGGELSCVCWVDARGFTTHEFGDALLAVGGGEDNVVQIFSVAEAKVMRLLKGHSGKLVALASGASDDGGAYLAVLATNGTVTVWDWRHASVRTVFTAPGALSMEMNDQGDVVYTGHADGKVLAWPIVSKTEKVKKTVPAPAGSLAGTVGAVSDSLIASIASPTPTTVNLGVAHGSSPVDCVRCLPGDRLATKSVDGQICVRGDVSKSPTAESLLVTFKVPGCVPPKKAVLQKSLTSFGCDPRGTFLACGNSDGETYVYDLATGELIKCVKQVRISQSPHSAD
jgi:WD40 repeat protein